MDQPDRQRVADRLNKIDGEIARFESDREKVIDRQVQLLTRTAGEGRPAKLGAKNAAKQAKKNAIPPETSAITRASSPIRSMDVSFRSSSRGASRSSR